LTEVHDKLGNDPLNIHLQTAEADLQKEHGDWLTHEESQMRQKSREL